MIYKNVFVDKLPLDWYNEEKRGAFIPATELLLKIILKREDIAVISVDGQKGLKNPVVGGRDIRLDILAEDSTGKRFNIEVQRSSKGAHERRARYHSSMVDARMLKKGQAFQELLDSYVIFITEEDYFGRKLPLYTVKRHVEEIEQLFLDGSHIIYVNGSYRGEDALGKLMHDFGCKDAKEIYYTELANGVRHFKRKEEGGRETMSEIVEEYAREVAERHAQKVAIRSEIEAGIEYGIPKGRVMERLCGKYGLSLEKAEEAYNTYASLAV